MMQEATEACIDYSDMIVAQYISPYFPTIFNCMTLFLPHNKTQTRVTII